jgi:hypothetical protein
MLKKLCLFLNFNEWFSMKFSDEIISLGKSLSKNGAQYKAEELFQGLKNEQIRLGKNPFVVLVNINSFDMDGLTDYVFLMDSFPEKDVALAYAKKLSNDLLEYQLKQGVLGRPWILESEDSSPYLPKSNSGSCFQTLLTKTFKTVSGEFDRKYIITRVMKSDGNLLVEQPLFDAINSNSELWSYFVGVGESTDGKREWPTPFFNG